MEGQHSATLCQHGPGRPGVPMQEGDRGTDCLRITRGPKLRGSFSGAPPLPLSARTTGLITKDESIDR